MFMKIRFSVFLSLLLSSLIGYCQMDYRVTSGIIAFNQEDYKTALNDLDEALEDISKLNTNNISQAFLFRGKAKMELLFKATTDNDQEAVALYQNALFEASADFTNALKYDNGRNKEVIYKEMSALYNPLLQSGLSMLQSVYDKTYTGNEVHAVLQYANKCIKTALEIEETYVAYDILGQIELNQKDSVAALQDFKKARDLFKEDESRKPDLLIGYVYYRIALIENYSLNNADTSIIVLKEGQEILESEFGKLKEREDYYTEQDWENIEFQYYTIMDDLKNLELDTYLNTNGNQEHGLAIFEEALKEKPDDYMLLVGYGSLLEGEDTEEAILIYKKAIGIDGKKDLAFYKLGVLYFNLGAKSNEKAHITGTMDSAAIYKNEAQVYFAEALPYLQRAFEIDPYSLETLRALKQISLVTNRDEDYKLYQEFENRVLDKGE
jgi:tetratricopeptide (TPR) repeat protein